MKKKTKRLLSVLTAAALSVSALGVNASAAVITFKLYKSPEKDTTATVIKAVYNDDGTLEKAEIVENMNIITTHDTEYEVNVNSGKATYYLWNMEEGQMIPLADPFEIPPPQIGGETPGPDETANPGETTTPDVTPKPGETTNPDITPEPGGNGPIFEGDTVEKTWKFDFGAEGATPEAGYTLVTKDAYYNGTTAEYGFLGTNENDYKLGNRYDGFGTQQGQVINLVPGGSAENDAIGATGVDIYDNAMDVYYPTRFTLKAEEEHYYRVRATVTTLDPTQDAEISLYTERKHPIFTDAKVAAGTTKTVEFSVRPTPIYYEKSDPKGTIADGMVNIAVAGPNSALATLEIQEVQEYPVFWVLGDSTVTDGNCSLPFFKPQNYTGVGTGLTKYLPRDIAMVNEGEGGLTAADSAHFNMVKNRIKAGDYLYVEYGHNHKNDGPDGYKSCLQKYLDACNSAQGGKANLIIVSPIERINQWDDATKKYTHSLDGFAKKGKEYVDEQIAAGADNIAYVDLNTYSLDFYNKIVADNENSANAIKYYFQTGKGAGTDTTHPNDAGAENLAYEFFKAAKAVTDPTQKAVLDGFLNNMTEETPNLLPESITSTPLGGDAWPTYLPPVSYAYPVVIDDVQFNEDGSVKQVDVKTQPSKIIMDSYGIIIITITGADGTEKGKIYAVAQVDNSTGYGPQTITEFRGEPEDLVLEEGDTYSAVVMKAKDSGSGLVVDESNTAFSAVYVPTNVEKYLITNEDGDDFEDFDYFGANYDGGEGATNLTDKNDWVHYGSGGATLTLGQSGDTKYANIITDGIKGGNANQGSFYVSKVLSEEIGTTGKYMISADMKYLSGGGLNVGFVVGNTSSAPWGSETMKAFTINTDGKVSANNQEVGTLSASDFNNVTYILDIDKGTASISVAGGDAVEYSVANYDTPATDINPKKLTGFMFDSNKVAVGIQVANLKVAKLKSDALPKHTLTVESNNDTWGTAEITQEEAEPVKTATADLNTVQTVVAKAQPGYVFVNWTDGDEEVSTSAEYTFRLRKTYTLKANFAQQHGAADTANFKVEADKQLVKAGEEQKITFTVSDIVDSDGNGVVYTDSDIKVEPTSPLTAGTVTGDKVEVTVPANFEIDDDTVTEVPVKFTVGSKDVTYNISVYSYEFYENVKNGKLTATYDGTTDTVNGRDAICFSLNGTNMITLPAAVTIGDNTVISFKASQLKGCGQLRTISICDSAGQSVITEALAISWGTLYVGGSKAGDSQWQDAVGTLAGAVPASWASDITITLNKSAGTGTVAFGETSASVTLTGTDIASIKLQADSGAGADRMIGITDLIIK